MAVKLKKRKRSRVPDYTYLGCRLTKHRSAWCYGLCVPEEGLGACGRIAPHSMTGRTQDAIRRYNQQSQG